MAENDPNPKDLVPAVRDTALSYRCVCGEMTLVDSGSTTCSGCGRHYDYESLCGAMAATAVLYTEGMEDPSRPVGPANTNDDLIGKRLGHFRILSLLGRGGMGAVYRALDESLQRYVALKVIFNPHPAANDAGLQGIFQEARAQARVNHPHVAHIYYVGSDADMPFLAMELVGERTLADRMSDSALPFDEIVRFALQIAEALRHAAMFDIVHGDVKPNNVLLVDDHTAKLSDFGLARRLSESGATPIAAGTPEFVSPEVTLGQPPDHRSDMYSLGVTLFKMTFGRLPYTPSSHDLSETLRLHRDAGVEFPDSWPVELPLSWRGVLARMLEKEPGDRYQDFDQLIRELKEHEPIVLPTASPLLRGFAWLFDGLLLSLPLLVIALLFSSDPISMFPLARIAMQCGIAFGICYLQAVWGTTPGKRLFQIRIVDLHGLTPSQPVLGTRAVLQFVWAWSMIAERLLDIMGLELVGIVIFVAAHLLILSDILLIVFARGRSIHDRLFRTRVVLDAGPRSAM